VSSTSIGKGYDTDYYTGGVGTGYYFGGKEPPGQWIGKGLPALGLRAGQQVDQQVMRDLYLFDTRPDGTPLTRRQRNCQYDKRSLRERVEAAVAERIRDLGRFVTEDEKRRITFEEHKKVRTNVALYDITHSAEKSVSLMFAGFLALARRARQAGDEAAAEQAEKRARDIEAAVTAGADETFGYIEQKAAYIRTGHHSVIKGEDAETIRTGEWRDAHGLVAGRFLQHTNRDDEPALHVHMPILNRAQRADMEDGKWRALHGQAFWQWRLAAGARATLRQANELARLGFLMVKQESGQGYDIAGVDQETMDAFSKRTVVIARDLAQRVRDFEERYGRSPNLAELRRMGKAATLRTRRKKAKQSALAAEADDAEALLGKWQERAIDAHVQQLDTLPGAAGQAYAARKPLHLPSSYMQDEMIRAAAAEVQRHHASWTRTHFEHELQRQVPVLPAAADWVAFFDALSDRAFSGQVDDLDILPVGPVPDVVDVAPLGLRKDSTSVHRYPGEARFVLKSHLDLEEWVLKSAGARVRQRITDAEARVLLRGQDLDPWQYEAVKGMLTSDRFFNTLVAPAGTGKTTAMKAFTQAWMRATGCRVIGLTASENAARNLAAKGVPESWNISMFFAKHIRVHEGDVLVIDEASQVDTVQLAKLQELADYAGATIKAIGDTEQLPSVDAGGMFGLIAHDLGHWKLEEVHRMRHQWEREASLRLHKGDETAFIEYRMHGRIHDGAEDVMYDEAVTGWITDHSAGHESMLLGETNAEAATLARLARERLVERGLLERHDDVVLRDGNDAGAGDLVRARLNTHIDAGGQRLTNRDVFRITGFQGTGTNRQGVAERQLDDGTWSRPFLVPLHYLREDAELAYSGNTHTAQGRDVYSVHGIAREGNSRRTNYVMTTRGIEASHLYVVTGPAERGTPSRFDREQAERDRVLEAAGVLRVSGVEAAVEAAQPAASERQLERATWESVLSSIMQNEGTEVTAIEAIREAQAFATNTRHLVELREAFWRKDVVPQIDAMVRARVTPAEYARYLRDPERPVLLEQMRGREIGGQPISRQLDEITADPLTGSRSIAAVLHGRLGKSPAPEWGTTTRWTQRNPVEASTEAINETGTALEARQAELGRQMLERPPAWALDAWGVPPREAGALRDDWAVRAGVVASYRELAGVSADHALGPMPHDHAERREAWHAAMRALALPDEAALLRAMGRGELEAKVLQGERVLATAKPDVSAHLGDVAAARVAAGHQVEAARAEADHVTETSAWVLERTLATAEADLNIKQAARAGWEEMHGEELRVAREAEAELSRRGHERQVEPEPEPRPENEAGADPVPEPEVQPGVEAEVNPEPDAGPDPAPAAKASMEIDDPEVEAVVADIDAALERTDANVARQHEREAEEAAKAARAGIGEPAVRPEPAPEIDSGLEIGEPEIAWEAPSPAVAREPEPEPVRVDDEV
jgi:conjugative relaxase-like TrwC/TraI family protein